MQILTVNISLNGDGTNITIANTMEVAHWLWNIFTFDLEGQSRGKAK